MNLLLLMIMNNIHIKLYALHCRSSYIPTHPYAQHVWMTIFTSKLIKEAYCLHLIWNESPNTKDLKNYVTHESNSI